MSRRPILTTLLACAVGAALWGTAVSDEFTGSTPGDSDITLRRVDYDPQAKVNNNLPPVIPYDGSESGRFFKNVSSNKTSQNAAAKAKFNAGTFYVPAQKADGTPLDERDAEGNCIVGDVVKDADGTADDNVCQVQPIVVNYDEELEPGTDVSDIFLAISLDDGATYKRYNLSRTADLSSFNITAEDGTEVPYMGDSRKAVQQVKGRNIAVAWTDKFCKAGRPAYAECELDADGNPVADPDDPEKCVPLYPDYYGVAGSQGSINYDLEKDSEDLGLGEIPFSCVWASRATINGLGYMDPQLKPIIQVFKAERLTSGRRDAIQIFMGGAGGGPAGGFAIAWQEDPDGLNSGSADGPGFGFSGATASNQTDIWYSYITAGDFAKIDTLDIPNGDGQDQLNEDGTPRVRAMKTWSLPVRITDNAACNENNYLSPGRQWCNTDFDGDTIPDYCAGFSDDGKCIAQDGRLLNGDTAASRPNLFLQPYTDLYDNVIGAWAILAYEETKGLGEFVPDYCDGSGASDYPECAAYYALFQGKDVYYHSFEFRSPETIAKGLRVNGPAILQETGDVEFLDETFQSETDATLHPADARYLTENARRIRFILQGAGAVAAKKTGDSRTPLVAVWKEGIEGKGGPSDIMLTRMVAPLCSLPGDKCYDPLMNPYAAENFVCSSYSNEDPETCLDGRVQNMSAQSVLATTDTGGDNDGVKVTSWGWTLDNMDDVSWENPYDNAVSHRGQIRGDFVIMGYSWTPNWAAARNGNDVYNFYLRRSFDGGRTWTTDPGKFAPSSVQHCERIREVQGEGAELVCMDIAKGAPEPPRNVSLLKNNKETVAEPRIVSPPGTIKACLEGLEPTACLAEDKQDKAVVFVSYGLRTNVDGNVAEDEEEPIEQSAPTDMYFARTVDYGSTFEYDAFRTEEDNPEDPEVVWAWAALAKDFQSMYVVEEGEAQLRMTPAGNQFWAVWLAETTDQLKGGGDQ